MNLVSKAGEHMTGLAGLGVVGNWSVDIDEAETSAWGLTIRSRGFWVQLLVANMSTMRQLHTALASSGEDVMDFAIGEMFGSMLLISIANESMAFRVADRRQNGVSPHPALFRVSFDEQAERADLASALKMALDEAESA
jgi:hypothetical protein